MTKRFGKLVFHEEPAKKKLDRRQLERGRVPGLPPWQRPCLPWPDDGPPPLPGQVEPFENYFLPQTRHPIPFFVMIPYHEFIRLMEYELLSSLEHLLVDMLYRPTLEETKQILSFELDKMMGYFFKQSVTRGYLVPNDLYPGNPYKAVEWVAYDDGVDKNTLCVGFRRRPVIG